MDWKKKLSSRKLWASIIGILVGVAMVFGLDENTITTVSGAIVALASVATYIVTEGKVDAAGVANASEKVQDAIEAVEKTED